MNKKYAYFITLLLIASLIAFGQILGNNFINFDDNEYIIENNHIKSGLNAATVKWAFTSVVSGNWHPLTLISHTLDWSLFKDHAGGHHFISLLLHIGSALFLFLFLNKTTQAFLPSAFVAALFALHPLRVESVAWAAERKDVLSMFFGLATLYAYALYVEKNKLSKYFLCLLLFALGLMAKPMLVTLPFVFVLLDYWPLGRWQKALATAKVQAATSDRLEKKKIKQRKADYIQEKKISSPVINRSPLVRSLLWEKVPFFVLGVVSSILTIWAQNKSIISLQKLPFAERVNNAIVSYVAYLGKFFWPVDLAVFYPYSHSFPIWQVSGAAAILLIISFAVFYFRRRAPFFLVGWLWYLGTLVPVIGLVQVGRQAIADRYTYLPSIGIGIMLTWGIVYFLPQEKLRKVILLPAAGIVLSVLTILTWQQCGYWKNSITLFSHALQATKDNYLAHDSLGVALDAEGKHQEAMEQYKSAIKINPDYANAYYNLASAFKDQKNIVEAEKNFRETIRINPGDSDAHNNLGIILEQHYKKYDDAIYHYRQALKKQPDNFGVHYNMGLTLVQKGSLEEAIKHFRTAVYLKPDYEPARQMLRLTIEEMQKQTRR
ncbi:MAG: tetratricopeptide repeat protein [Smithellaceae bacterium]